MKKGLFIMLCPLFIMGQIQIGKNINGEYGLIQNYLGKSVSASSDGTVIAVAAPSNYLNGVSSGQVKVYKKLNDSWTQVGSDILGEDALDFSGESISLSSDGNTIAVGAEKNGGNGIDSGHVRIYKNINDSWVQIGDDLNGEASGDLSGHSVSLSSDGNIVAIGAPRNSENGIDSGHVRIYKNINDAWVKVGNDLEGEAAGNRFGEGVSLSSDGNIVAIRASRYGENEINSGYVGIYKNINDTWVKVGNSILGEGKEGFSRFNVSLSSNGNVVAIGTSESDNGNDIGSGRVKLYENINDSWVQVGNDINGEASGDRSGFSISLSEDGQIVAIGAFGNDENGMNSGHVRIYKNNGGSWIRIGSDINGEAAGDLSGYSVSLSSDGNVLVIGGPENDENGIFSGHVRIFKNLDDNWVQVGNDLNGDEGVSGDELGGSVSLSSNGNIIAIGAPKKNKHRGAVAIYKNINGSWTQIGSDIQGEAKGDFSGESLKLSSDGSLVAIGSRRNEGNGINSGHVRVYRSIDDDWIQVGNDIDGETAGDRFGESIDLSLDGNILAVGAPGSNGNGIRSGIVRIYKIVNDSWIQLGNNINGEAVGDLSGQSISLSSNGNIIAIGAPRNDGNDGNIFASGHVRVYRNVNDSWIQIGNDIDGEALTDLSGQSISLSSNGNIIAIGAPRNDGNGSSTGHVRVYSNINDNWVQLGKDIDGDASKILSGEHISLSANGSIIAIGARRIQGDNSPSGHVRIYRNINDSWIQVGSDIDSDPEGFITAGSKVSLSSDGTILAIGAAKNDENSVDSGQVKVYDLNTILSTKSFQKDYFSFYPNPVKDILHIQLHIGQDLKQVNIYNLQSQYLYSVKTSKIDVGHLSTGVYFIEVETNQGKSAKKIIIQ